MGGSRDQRGLSFSRREIDSVRLVSDAKMAAPWNSDLHVVRDRENVARAQYRANKGYSQGQGSQSKQSRSPQSNISVQPYSLITNMFTDDRIQSTYRIIQSKIQKHVKPENRSTEQRSRETRSRGRGQNPGNPKQSHQPDKQNQIHYYQEKARSRTEAGITT